MAFQVSLLDLQLCPSATKADKKVLNHLRKGPAWWRKELWILLTAETACFWGGLSWLPLCLLLQGKCYFCFMPPAHLWEAKAAAPPWVEKRPSSVCNGAWSNSMWAWPHKLFVLGALLTILGGSSWISLIFILGLLFFRSSSADSVQEIFCAHCAMILLHFVYLLL